MGRKIYLQIVISISLIMAIAFVSRQAMAQQKTDNQEKLSSITNQQKILTVYPLPVSSTVHIRLSPSLRLEVQSLEIVSLVGRKLADQRVLDPNTTDVSFSNLEDYPAGIYMVIARDKYGKIVKSAKMIISR